MIMSGVEKNYRESTVNQPKIDLPRKGKGGMSVIEQILASTDDRTHLEEKGAMEFGYQLETEREQRIIENIFEKR